MNIGYDAKRIFCNVRGLGNYSRTLVANLQRMYPENEFHLYTPKLNNNRHIYVQFLNENFKLHLPKSSKNLFWRLSGVVNELKKNNIDIYHGLSHEIPIGIGKTKIKSVVTIHDLIFKANRNAHSFIDRHMYSFKSEYSCKNSDRIIAISNNTKRDIINYFNIEPEKIDVIYQSCNPLFYQQNSSYFNRKVLDKLSINFDYFVFVGSAEQNKNLNLIVEAYKLLSVDLRIPVLLISKGESRYKQNVQLQISRFGLDKYFIWIDNLNDNKELQSLYQCSKGLIFPSYYEGFGLPLVEALLSEAPVLSSNRSSLLEAGGPDSLYFDPDSPDELAAGIEKVLSDAEHVERMKSRGLAYALNNFQPELFVQNVMNCYQKTLNV